MREMGWNYFEYRATPAIVIERCWKGMNTETKSRNFDQQEQEMKRKHGGR
jgi:hypothetical protein